MDKEPTIAANWLYALLGGFVVVLAWRVRWWLGAALSAVWLSGLWVVGREITDAAVHPAILREAGQRYFVHFYLSVAVAVALQATAIYLGCRTHRVRRPR